MSSTAHRECDGVIVTVDEQGSEILHSYRWRCRSVRGKLYVVRYARVNGRQATIYLHRQLTSPPDGLVVDHIDGDGSNNRRSNLRLVTTTENNQNIRGPKKCNKSGFLGVDWHAKSKKWRAQIRMNYKFIHIGYFDTPEQASLAYIAKKRELHQACTI